ncbi:ABC transporter substrate-binding protein [Aeromonas bestiarum]|uniref:ABC transporter substrate-binding protein n=1 Tax=Aeromonas bestiarum TaxID=105751 RepID=UPI0036711864
MKHLGLGAVLLLMLGAILLGVAGSGSDRLSAAEPEHPSHFSAYLGLLPGLIDSDGSGPFVDLVKAIAALDDGVEVSVMVYPMSRATRSVVVGEADFNLPALRNPYIDESMLPYRFSSVTFGKVTHVLYSNSAAPITPAMVLGYEYTKRDLLIEGVSDFWPFSVKRSLSIEQSLGKLSRGRIDAFLWAQEEADFALKKMGLTNIHRVYFGEFDDVFIIPKGERGDAVDRFLTQSIERLRATGKLGQIYSGIHGPYQEWQPGESAATKAVRTTP